MLEISNTEVFGLERAIKASGNSYKVNINSKEELNYKDWKRGFSLGSAQSGQGHDGYLKGIIVYFDIKYSQYWTPEFQRYHYAEILMSTSKIYSLVKNANSDTFKNSFNEYVDEDIIEKIKNYALEYNNCLGEEKYYWFMKILSNLPCGYELEMTICTNYLQLKTIFQQRVNHKLKEWHTFCKWCTELPSFSELTGCVLPNDYEVE